MMDKKKVTILDIAEKCGVSAKTVSRVINKDNKVAPATREKVEEAIRENNYHANIFARGLKGEHSGIIIIFIDRHNGEFLSVWHEQILRGLFYYLRMNGLKAVVSPSNSMDAIKDSTDGFSILANGMADGAILLENTHNDSRIRYFQENHVPFVLFGEPDEQDIYSVSLNNYKVGYEGGNFLLNKGYRNIALFIGEKKFLGNQHRILGFQNACNQTEGIYNVYSEIDSIEKAYHETNHVIKCQKGLQAIFVSGDERALGVYKALRENALSIPDDVAVMGIDNILYGQFYYPTLTTIDQNFDEMARNIVCLLKKQLDGEKISLQDRNMEVDPVVIERESTKNNR